MHSHINYQEENVDVEQRSMDTVSVAILAGSVASILVVLGGTITLVGGKYEFFTYGAGLFIWLTVLSGLTMGLFVFSYILTTFLTKLPQQSTTATVL